MGVPDSTFSNRQLFLFCETVCCCFLLYQCVRRPDVGQVRQGQVANQSDPLAVAGHVAGLIRCISFCPIIFLFGNPLCLFLRLLKCPYGVSRAPHSPRVHDVVLDHQVGADGADP